MTFLVPPFLHDKKLRKTHWAPMERRKQNPVPMTECGKFLFIGGRFGRGVQYAEYDPGFVTCHICLYRMGLYVPLVKLREHQNTESAGRAKYGKRDPYYAVMAL